MKKTLSVVISVFNEEQKIKDCLESVQFADEIILIDNMSTDKTVEIAKKYTKHIFVRENNPMLNVNKNFGFQKASGDWILSLDADERVTPELAEEIQKTLEQESSINGYLIPRKNIIFGKWIEHTGWYPDYQLRLFKKGKGKFAERHVHELVAIEGEPATLENSFMHLNYESVSQFMRKLTMIYAENEADNLLKSGYRFSWRDAIQFPFQEFLMRYFLHKGYKDGLHGLVLSLLMACYHLVVFAFLWEKKGFKQVSEQEIAKGFSTEMFKVASDWEYWIHKQKIDNEKNPLKKHLYKLRAKLQ